MGAKRLTLPLIALMTLLAACAPQRTFTPTGDVPGIPEKPTLLRIALDRDPPSFGSRFGGFNGRYNQLINAFLARIDHRGELVPYLTERLPTQEDGTWVINADGTMRTTWTLRSDARWQDGQPVTAHDVVFANTLYVDPELTVEPSGSSRSEPFISSVVALNDRTFEVHWTQPKLEAGQPKEGDLVPLPWHLLEERYNTGDKQAFNVASFWTTNEYVGAGPYRVTKRDPGVGFTLTANPLFFLGKPRIDTIEVLIVPDTNAIVARLLAGDIDFSEVINAEQALVLREQWKATNVGQVHTTQNKSSSVIFQQRDVPNHQEALRDPRVRRALVHAIDREALVAAVTGGFSPVADIGLPPSYSLYQRMSDAAMKYPFDAGRAEQLLGEAGWTRGADGMLRNAAGRLLDLEMFGANTTHVVIVDYWRRAGVNAAPLFASESADLSAETSFSGAAIDTKGPFLYADMSAAQLPSERNRFTGKNRPSWVDPDYEAILPRFERSLVQLERDDLAVELERLLTTSVGAARLHYNPEPAAARSNVRGVKGKSMGQIPTYIWNIHEWTIE
jgi:peptide/nickel transport system substrate-binding protein